MKYRARIKATGEEITVADYGATFIPRYWTDKYGYNEGELEILGEVE